MDVSRRVTCLNRGCDHGLVFPYENGNDVMGVTMHIDVQAIVIDAMLLAAVKQNDAISD